MCLCSCTPCEGIHAQVTSQGGWGGAGAWGGSVWEGGATGGELSGAANLENWSPPREKFKKSSKKMQKKCKNNSKKMQKKSKKNAKTIQKKCTRADPPLSPLDPHTPPADPPPPPDGLGVGAGPPAWQQQQQQQQSQILMCKLEYKIGGTPEKKIALAMASL